MRYVALGILATWGCVPDEPSPAEGVIELPYAVPEHFPMPRLPVDNLPTEARVRLGERLFFDTRLSANETQSCGSCHLPSLAFSDGKPTPIGSTGDAVPRNAMPLANVAWLSSLTWANPLLEDLESQALVPLFADHPDPIELGITTVVPEVEARLSADSDLAAAFEEAYGDVSIDNAVRAIATYERSLVSGNSRYDRYIYGLEADALSEEEKLGLSLFNSERGECYHCHSGVFFTSATTSAKSVVTELGFENNGLYDVDAPEVDPTSLGLFNITREAKDRGFFRVPTLRNIAVTAPYMHDGSLATLEDVMAHYMAGGRGTAQQNAFVRPLDLTPEEQAALLAFLRALTDEGFLAEHSE